MNRFLKSISIVAPRAGWLEWSLAALLGLAGVVSAPPLSAGEASRQPAGFQRRGFYLHGSWVMNHPFGVRTWDRADFERMFRFLGKIGFDTVMLWPTLECAPMPLSPEDAQALRHYRRVIDDAKAAGLGAWLVYCPAVIAGEEVRSEPWAQRSLYANLRTIRLNSAPQAASYLAHRRAVLQLVDNTDAVVVIDGDPGGYPGAPIDEYIRILRNDQQALPGRPVIPWIWSGWGRDTTRGGFWQEPVEPAVAATLAALRRELQDPWELMPGRSHREGWANGRTNIELADRAGLIGRSTLMCYEAIEFEPTPPAATLQFDHIRRALREESVFARVARGVFGNAQQPIMVLPNLYFFARAAADPSYLERQDHEILTEFARALGGDPAVLVPAWSCLRLSLADLPEWLPRRLRASKLASSLADCIPGGSGRYLEILAAQVESRRNLLEAVARPPATTPRAAENLAAGAAALLRWWQVHRYVGPGKAGAPFRWSFLPPGQVGLLREYAAACSRLDPEVLHLAAAKLKASGLLPEEQVPPRLNELLAKSPVRP